MVIVLAGAAYGESSEELLLTDFGARQLPWVTVNDNVMGGRSKGDFVVEEGILVFTGSTNTNGGGFSSIRSRPQKLGLEGREAIRLRVRGDGRTYTFRLATGDSRANYWAEFPTTKDEWTEVRLPFDSFVAQWRGRRLDVPPPDPKKVESLGLMIYDKRDGAFRLEVDWIRAAAPFSLDGLKWKRRPMLVFAPRGDDPRLKQQIDAVGEARVGFEERDMALIVVAPGHELSGAEREKLRADFDVEDDAFAVRLVGKDGKVKQRAAEPVPMADLYALIDRMPMRRSEMDAGSEE